VGIASPRASGLPGWAHGPPLRSVTYVFLLRDFVSARTWPPAFADEGPRGAVEKHINNIFAKLGLAPGDRDNRRVIAVLRYLETG
jgi:hypothetical protein